MRRVRAATALAPTSGEASTARCGLKCDSPSQSVSSPESSATCTRLSHSWKTCDCVEPSRVLNIVKMPKSIAAPNIQVCKGDSVMTATTLDSVRTLAPVIREHADGIEQERSLPKPVIRGLIDAGVFRMLAPRSLGGDEIDPMTACRVIEEVAAQDGSTGWCAMIGACNSHFGGLLPAAGAREIFADRDVVLAGTFRPTGVAVPVDGGYRVTGRWPFASGITHSYWLMGGCSIAGGGPRLMFLPRGEAHVLDTWYTVGLRGTGSHDFEVNDVFVPVSRSLSFSEPPVERGPLYSMPAIALFSTLIASVSLGVARHALEVFKNLARVKKPTGSQELLRASAVTQSRLGEAEGLLRAGRALLFESLGAAWEVRVAANP
jgi:alkylation response protein AidB-like acyl-CoA dehydrogenase